MADRCGQSCYLVVPSGISRFRSDSRSAGWLDLSARSWTRASGPSSIRLETRKLSPTLGPKLIRGLTADPSRPAAKVNRGRGTQARMGESHRSFGRADDFPADPAAGHGRPLRDPGGITRCTGRPAPLLVDRLPIQAAGTSCCDRRGAMWGTFSSSPRPGLDLPGHRAFRHLRPGVASHGDDPGPRPVCDRLVGSVTRLARRRSAVSRAEGRPGNQATPGEDPRQERQEG